MLSVNVDPSILPVFRWSSRPALILHLSVVFRLTAQHIPLNCTAAHCIVAAAWLTLFHITFPSCVSLPVDCHLPFRGNSFRSFSAPLTLRGHESTARYMLHVTLVQIFIHPRHSKPALLYLSVGPQHFLRFPNKLLWSHRFCKAAVRNSQLSCTLT